MNVPPTDGIRVAVPDLEQLVVELFEAVPIPEDHARLIAGKLVECDLRGVVSHGVLQVNRYVRSFQDGTVNPNPQIRVLKEGPTTAALSGDGGLGYLVATKAMAMAISKAQEVGIGATTSTYHAHLGSTGNYARMAMRADLIGISTSGRNAADHYIATRRSGAPSRAARLWPSACRAERANQPSCSTSPATTRSTTRPS